MSFCGHPGALSRKMPGIVLDGHKLSRHRDRVETWLAGERIVPITIDMALTRRCTQRCVFCYGALQSNDERRMTRDVLFRFLDDAAEIGVKAISLISDGESTCSPHVYDFILHARGNGLDISLATNGVLLRDDRLEDILPALTYIRFNVSAADPGRYAHIHGCPAQWLEKVCNTIRECVRIKRERGIPVTIGLQMVLMPDLGDQVLPLTRLGKELGVDYFVIKHCSDDELGTLGIDYSKYFGMVDLLKEAEAYSDEDYLVKAKWSKILAGRERSYSRCYGPVFMPQFSGSGLVAPCGMLFNRRYKKGFHIGNIAETSFKEIWQGERYWQVMDFIASERFDARTSCGCLCLQHLICCYLDELKKGLRKLDEPKGAPPLHVNFL